MRAARRILLAAFFGALLAAPGASIASITYKYDDLGRLVRVEYPNGDKVVTYQYDAAGNRTVVETAGLTNTAPVAQNDSITTDEDVVREFDPRSNDSDAEFDPLTIVAKTDGAKGSVTIINSGQGLRYTPNLNANGADSFTYTISDGALNSSPATVSVTINAVNDAPVATNDSVSVTAGAAHDFDPLVNDSDPENGALTITAKTDGAKGTVAIIDSGTRLRYTANAGATGSDSFTYTITDPQGATSTATVNVTITASNQPPVAADDLAVVTSGGSVVISVLSNDSDPEGGPLTIISVTAGAKGTPNLHNNNTQIMYFANPGSSGTDTFNYTIRDTAGATDTATVSVQILLVCYDGNGNIIPCEL